MCRAQPLLPLHAQRCAAPALRPDHILSFLSLKAMCALLCRISIGAGAVVHTGGARVWTALRVAPAASRDVQARCDRTLSDAASGASGRLPSCPQLCVGGRAGPSEMRPVRELSPPFALRAYSTDGCGGDGAPPQPGARPVVAHPMRVRKAHACASSLYQPRPARHCWVKEGGLQPGWTRKRELAQGVVGVRSGGVDI